MSDILLLKQTWILLSVASSVVLAIILLILVFIRQVLSNKYKIYKICIFSENSLGHNSYTAVIKSCWTSLLHPLVSTNSFSVPIGKLGNNLSYANAKCTMYYGFFLSKLLAQYYINFDLFQIVFTMFLIVYTYLNTSKTQEFQVKYTGTDVSSASLSGCQNHQSCMFNETMPLTENR